MIALAVAAPVQAQPQGQPQDATATPRFDILEFVVEGNSVLSTEAIERSVYPFMGPERTVDDVQAARAALEKRYRDQGYGSVSVDIPEQKVDSGVIALQVLEGRIARTRVTGSRYFSQGYILAQVPAAAEGTVPNFPQLAQQLAIVNRSADRRVTPLLRPGRIPGTTEVDLVVKDERPLHGSVELNNRVGANVSETRLAASARYDNLFQRDHSLSLALQVAPQRTEELKLFAATYTVPVGPLKEDSVALSYVHSDTQVPAGVAETVVSSRIRNWGLRRNTVVKVADGEYHLLTVGADYKDSLETVSAGDAGGFSTPIRILPLSLGYLGLLDDPKGRWQLGGTLSAGLRNVVNQQRQFDDKRFMADASYSLLKLDLAREQNLPWAGLQLALRAEAQLASGPLVPTEQFVVGGVDSVRGYLESAAVGDGGYRGSVELRSPELAAKTWPWIGSLKLHGYFDGAVAELRDPLPGQLSTFRLLSAGFGLRLAGKGAPGSGGFGRVALDLGWPLRDLSTAPRAEGTPTAAGFTAKGDLRVHASAALEF